MEIWHEFHHASKNIALIGLSLAFLPLSTFLVISTLVLNIILGRNGEIKRRDAILQDPKFRPKAILVTGVGMAKGLTLARSFYLAGHTVIGADFEPHLAPVSGRISKCLARFYTLQPPTSDTFSGSQPYVTSLIDIIANHNIDLWVSCSGVASALSDGYAQEAIRTHLPTCKTIQFDLETTQALHEKHTFIPYTASLDLPIPTTHTITSAELALTHLTNSPKGKRYILKPIQLNDASRTSPPLLPLSTPSATKSLLASLKVSSENPWIMQQYLSGPEYCTHALIISGQLRAFTACPSSELLMHYGSLPKSSKEYEKMEAFTREFAAKTGGTGHLSFDFMGDEEGRLLPIECNPRAHTAIVLFRGNEGVIVERYLSDGSQGEVVRADGERRYYWIGHDIVEFCILPLVYFQGIGEVVKGWRVFVEHVLRWYDGTFASWDPWPWWWLYHVYWPLKFLNCLLTGRKWSRVNVSTTKMFML